MADLPSGSDLGAQEIVIRDNTTATNIAVVKASSIPPTTLDAALVVTQSPNGAPQQYATGSGTVSALNGTVVATAGGSVIFDISGTWVGTFTIQATNGDSSWINVAALSNQSGLVTNTTTINGSLEMNASGWVQARLIATAWTSGTATVSWSSSSGNHVIIPYSANGVNFNTYTTLTDSSQNPLGTTPASTAATATQEALVVALSPNTPSPLHPDRSGSGTITALNGTVAGITNGCGSVTFNVTGTWVATLTIQATSDGVNWNIVNGSILAIDDTTQTFTNNEFLVVPCGGFSQVRLIATAFTSGTISITWNAGAGTSPVIAAISPVAASFNATVVQGLPATAIDAWPMKITDSGGVNQASVDATGELKTQANLRDGSGNAITSTVDGSQRGIDSNTINIQDNIGSGTITALNGTVAGITNGSSIINLQITGTWVATLTIQGTVDGSTWNVIVGDVDITDTIESTITANSLVSVPCGGYQQVRLIATAFTSGTASISWDASSGGAISEVFNTNVASLMATVNNRDGSGNSLTSSAQTTKQALDVAQVAIAASYYSVPVNIRQTAATAANATVFSMRNAAASTKTVYIERIELNMAFDTGTPLTRSLQRYDLERFSAATPTGGTAETVVLMDSSNAATQVTDVRFIDTGLTTTGVIFNTSFCTIGCPATDATVAKYQRSGISFKLAAGEGFCIRLNVAAVIGQSLTGEIVWSER